MAEVKRDMIVGRDLFPSCMPYFSGLAMMYRMKKKRLTRLMQVCHN